VGAQLIGERVWSDLASPLLAVDDAGQIDLRDPPVTRNTGIVTELAPDPDADEQSYSHADGQSGDIDGSM
jgi:hypothetical protein